MRRSIGLHVRWLDWRSVRPIGTTCGQKVFIFLAFGKGNAFKIALDDGNVFRIWPQLQLGIAAFFHVQSAVHIQHTAIK